MVQTVKQACVFSPVVRDYRMSDAIENLADLIRDEGDGREFFTRNYVTQGMDQLFREGMLRLSGKSDQAVFELTQAMGGGKTHMMIALGLLARHPHLRSEVLPEDLVSRISVGQARIAAFNGRNNPDHFLWGEIANQLGEAEKIKPYWVNGPKPVDQEAWKSIIGEHPTLIMLDELPPYLEVASTQVIGQGTLATMVTYSLSCLLSAALELPNCCILIANLSGSYHKQTKALAEAISNIQQETRRQAQTITPVQLAGNEIYEILKKRLISELPAADVIDQVAEEYASRIKMAVDGGYILTSSLDQIKDQIRETYPFHPSFKHLVALFKENEGFRQTRGLMQFTARLLKSVADREQDDVYLVGAQHLNLNDETVKDELERIAPALRPAITRDIADGGDSVAEKINEQLDSDAASQVATLLFASSLSRAVGGRVGLTEGELIEFLTAPTRKPDEFKLALEKLREQAWYLHREDQRYFVRETENLSRQIERNAKDIPQPKIEQALTRKLQAILQPTSKLAYQELQVLPRVSDLRLNGPRVLIVVKPDGKRPPTELANFFEFQQEKNNLLVLSGQDSYMADAVEDRLRELYAIEQILSGLRDGDTLFAEARDRQEEAQTRFNKALSAAYDRLYFPSIDETDGSERLMMATIDQGLKMGQGESSAERQIEQLLASPRANYKLVLNLKDEYLQYWAMAEQDLWPERDRRTPWRDVLSRAKCNPMWTWMPSASGLDQLKAEAIAQGRWRQGEDGYIEKGPFPKEKTSVNVITQNTNTETGETTLTLTPRNSGSSPVVHYAETANVSVNDPVVADLECFVTKAATLYFLAIDSSGQHESGQPQRWVAELKIRHQVRAISDQRVLELQCIPDAKITYTLDGSNAKDGQVYEKPVEIGEQAVLLLVHARAGEAVQDLKVNIPAAGDKRPQIDDSKPAKLVDTKRVTLDTTEKVFGMVNRFKDKPNTQFKGVNIQIGEGEDTVTIRFGDRAVTAAMIEGAINGLRQILNDVQALVSVHIRSGAVFDSGYDVKEFAKLGGLELKAGDVVQDE